MKTGTEKNWIQIKYKDSTVRTHTMFLMKSEWVALLITEILSVAAEKRLDME